MITAFDFKFLDFLQELRTPFLDAVFSFITRLGDEGIIWILIALIMLCFKKTRKCGIIVALALILGTIVGNLGLKNIFARPRPFTLRPEMVDKIIISLPGSYSFPSGHTMSSFESAFAIFLYNKKWGIAPLILAILIGFSRNYLYVHYLTDVIAGAVLGIVVAVIVYFIYKKYIDGKKIGKFEL